ncbi:MAG TPA: hypothetical protein VNF50_06800 [Acidimicrobiales bacterium]|nr:hypothetical protein [Acidimicrobiales bacterium]
MSAPSAAPAGAGAGAGASTDSLVIDADSHVLEPADLWERYLEPRYRDRAIRSSRPTASNS